MGGSFLPIQTELPGLTNPHIVPLAAPEHGVWVPVTSYDSVLFWLPGLKVGTHPAMATSIPLVGPKVIVPYRCAWMCAQHEVGTTRGLVMSDLNPVRAMTGALSMCPSSVSLKAPVGLTWSQSASSQL